MDDMSSHFLAQETCCRAHAQIAFYPNRWQKAPDSSGEGVYSRIAPTTRGERGKTHTVLVLSFCEASS